jgi:hypothetical protein
VRVEVLGVVDRLGLFFDLGQEPEDRCDHLRLLP